MQLKLEPGQLLIAPPNMPDPRFHESVMMVVSHNETGTVAIALNGITELETQDIEDLRDPFDVSPLSHPIFWGGPVAPETLWMIHSGEWCSYNTLEITDNISVTSDIEMLEALKDGDTPKLFRVCSGFASWNPGQLEREMNGTGPWAKQYSWLTAPTLDLEWALECPVEDLWQKATELSAQAAVSSWLA